MKVGFLVDSVNFGGGEQVLRMLMKAFHRLGHDIYIYTWNKDWSKYKLDVYNIIILNGVGPCGLRGKLRSLCDLKIQLQEDKPDCLVIFALGLAEVAVWSAKLAGVPTILSERVDPRSLPKSKIHRLLKKITYGVCDGLVFQTSRVQSFFSKQVQSKSRVIQNPILYDTLPEPNLINPRKEIVSIGRLSEEKNYDLLIEAFSRISNTDYIVRIFGKGPQKEHLENKIRALNLCDKVILEGDSDNVINDIKDSEIFVMTSHHEGMPNALIEAMSMGLACITTDFPSEGARALIKSGINGVILPSSDVISLQLALLKLIRDDEYRFKLKSSALNIRITNSQDVIIPQWIEYILSIIYKNY